MQQQTDFANKNYYADKMKKANGWLTWQNLHQTLATNPELHAQYQALSDEDKELSQKYIELKQNVDENRQDKINYKVLKNGINATDQFAIPTKNQTERAA